MTTIPMLGVPITIPDDLDRDAQQAIARIVLSTGAASLHARNRKPMTSTARYGATIVSKRATAALAAASGDGAAWRALRESDTRCLRIAADQDRRRDEPLAEDVLAALMDDVYWRHGSGGNGYWDLGESDGASLCLRLAIHDFGDHASGCELCALAREGQWRKLVFALRSRGVSQRLILDLHESLVLAGQMGDLAIRAPRHPQPVSRNNFMEWDTEDHDPDNEPF
jgi:hypothetical protein